MQPKLEKTESTETVNASDESGEEVRKNILLRLSVKVFVLRIHSKRNKSIKAINEWKGIKF